MEKRDYYEVLGLTKSATKDEIKKHTVNYQNNITLTLIKSQVQMKNSKKSLKHMKY